MEAIEEDYEVDYKQAMLDLEYEVQKNDLDCADNYRAYKYGDDVGLHKYTELENQGCCGFFQSHTVINGEKWIIGCNYGH
jgi:hypothetical protein